MRYETTISIAIILLLLCLSGILLVKQSHYDKTLFTVPTQTRTMTIPEKLEIPQEEISSPQETETGLLSIPVKEISPMGEMETFGPQTLSDKIDGKADLYLEAGFIRLYCRRFSLAGNPSLWFECYLYDMGKPRNAFVVYSNQRRPNSRTSSLAPFSYESDNAVYFIQGKYYMEIVSGKSDTAMKKAIQTVAQSILKRPLDTVQVSLPELTYFPAKSLVQGSYKLYAHNAFGYDQFSNVMTAVYKLDKKEITLFIILQSNEEKAKKTAEGYHAFMVEYGGESWEVSNQNLPGLYGGDLLGDYDLVFSRGKVVAGVHGAKDKDTALKMASELYKYIGSQIQ